MSKSAGGRGRNVPAARRGDADRSTIVGDVPPEDDVAAAGPEAVGVPERFTTPEPPRLSCAARFGSVNRMFGRD